MRELIIYGAGGFGRETALMVRQINSDHSKWSLVGFCDDRLAKGSSIDGIPVIGGISAVNSYPSHVSVVIAVASPHVRKIIRCGITNQMVDFPSLVHPSAILGAIERNRVGEGSIITAGNILTTNVQIGSFVIINLMCTIGHDVTIGDYCVVMPGSSISGSVTLEEGVEIGSGARILPGITIGGTSRVGAGAVVTRNVPNDTTVVGIPARSLKHE